MSVFSQWPKRYTVIALVLLALLLCYIDRILISLASIEMQREFGWSDAEKGLVMSTFFVGYLIMQVLGGFLSNRFGGRTIFLVAVLLWSLVTVLTPPAAYLSFGVLLFARFMLGFGEGAAFPSAYNLIHAWMPVRERSVSIGGMSGASAVGTVSTLVLSGLIIETYGWPSVFYLFGGLGLVWGIAWLVKVPNEPPSLDDDFADGLTVEKPPIPWRILATHPAVWTIYLASICAGSISFTLASWLPSYFVDTFGLTLTQAGLYSTLPWVAVVLSTIAAGRYSDKRIAAGRARIRVRKVVTALGLIVVAVSCLAMVAAQAAVVAMLIVCSLFVGLGVAIVGYAPTAAELLPKHGDVFYGIAAAFGSVGALVVVTATGLILESTGSYNLLFLTLMAACVVTTCVYLVLGRADPLYEEN